MPLKDDWKDLENAVPNDPKSGSDLTVEPINNIAHAVIEIEKNGASGSKIVVDDIMSDTSENPVQNKVVKSYVDGLVGDIDAMLDELHNYAQALISGGDA